jgi:hypothetical protein
MGELMKKIFLYNRYALFAGITLFAFLLIMLEGKVIGRESNRFGFSSPLLDIRIN